MTAATDPPRDSQRLFFALMPPPGVAARIANAADRLGLVGRRIESSRLHLTLVFLGAVESAVQARLCSVAETIDLPAFTLVLDRLSGFQGPQIAWLGPSRPPRTLLDLAATLDKNTIGGIDNDRFRPHVSVRRGIGCVATARVEPIEWPVTHFSLLASGDGGQPGAYRELGRWPLERGRPAL